MPKRFVKIWQRIRVPVAKMSALVVKRDALVVKGSTLLIMRDALVEDIIILSVIALCSHK
jgi:hypothetical protein